MDAIKDKNAKNVKVFIVKYWFFDHMLCIQFTIYLNYGKHSNSINLPSDKSNNNKILLDYQVNQFLEIMTIYYEYNN